MKDAVFIIPKPSLLQEAVGIIDELDISGQSSDVQGNIYESLKPAFNCGKKRAVQDARHIIRIMLNL